jgi:predicted TIM-barrel fold metal-dependent hydrolase
MFQGHYMRTITLEEHYASPGFLDGPGRELKTQALKFGAAAAKLFEQLCDVGEKRIAEMDGAKIDMQVLSLTSPGTEQLEAADSTALAREANDFLADAVKKNPARFAGFAALQPQYQTKPRKNWSGWSVNTAPNERSSMVTAGDAIWTTNSSGQSSNEPKR